SAHDRSVRLSHSWTVAFAEAILGTRTRVGGGIHFAAACAVWRLVSLVVVTPNEVPLSLGDADPVRDQSHSRSRDGTWQARSSIVVDTARDNRGLRGLELADKSSPKRFPGCRYRK